MKKLCKHCNKYPVFGGGYCKYHQRLRTDKKPKPLKAKTKPSGEKQIFDEIWAERPHYSEISKVPLEMFGDSYFFVNMFAHVLNKKNYPKYRLNKDNIMLVAPYEHILIDLGTEDDRAAYEKERHCSFDIFYNKQKQLKEEYEKA